MSTPINAQSEMAFFSLLVRAGTLSAAAREMNVTTAGVSKRLSQMEARLGARLLHRTTRRIGLTAEGEMYLENARRILADIEDMEQMILSAGTAPKGLLRVNATLGFGRSHIAPLISAFHKRYPDVDVQLQLTVNPPSLIEDACDVWIRFGEPPDTRVIARRIAANRRLICASPAYLERHGTPRVPNDLAQNSCIGIRQGEEGYGIWHLKSGAEDGNGQGARLAQHQRRRDRRQLGAGGTRPDHARRMGRGEIPAERAACARCCRTGRRRRRTSTPSTPTSCRRRRACAPSSTSWPRRFRRPRRWAGSGALAVK